MGQSRSSLRHTSRSTHGASVELRLLDSFALRAGGDVVDLPSTGQRLVALVALHERPLTRDFAAGTLWPETPDTRAAGNLRSALWRVQKLAPGLLHVDPMTLRLEDTVDVDLHRLERLAHDQLTLTGSAPPDARDLAGDLLPGWYDDDWLLLERERLRQLRLQALDALAERHLQDGHTGRALEAAHLSLAGEPLRESAHRALIRVHLASGNAVEALRQYELCRRLLREQLGVEPSPLLRDALGGLDAAETPG